MTSLESPLVNDLIRLALTEDLHAGDITSEACIAAGEGAEAVVRAREPLVVCGLPLAAQVCACYATFSSIPVRVSEVLVREGQQVGPQTPLVILEGELKALLSIERTLLNLLQRLSGVASYTQTVVEQAGALTILDTRKTTPGWRMLEKYAVRVGGGKNHRASLGEMVLVKNNHVDCQQGGTAAERMRVALTRVQRHVGPYTRVEVEVRSEEELEAALPFNPHSIMLDNMGDAQISRAVGIIRAYAQSAPAAGGNARVGSPFIEVSGGVTPERLAKLVGLGVHGVSMGALTTKATNKDISMSVRLKP